MSSPSVNLIGSEPREGGNSSSATFPSTITDPEAPKKKPKRVLHFSDGILEEFSSDEENDAEQKRHAPQCYRSQSSATVPVKDPRFMRWGEYLLHLSVTIGVNSLHFCDYMGEKFAWMLGITTPKYGYAVDERAWRDKEKASEAGREERERAARAERNAIDGPDGGGTESRVGVENGVDLNDESEILSSEKERF